MEYPHWKHHLCLYSFGVLLAAGAGAVPQRAGCASTIVAVVDEHAIPYSAISVTPEMAKERFVFEHEREPESAGEFQEVKGIQHRCETQRLLRRIRAIIRETQIDRFGIRVTEDDIRERWETMKRRERSLPPTEVTSAAKLTALCDGLKAVYEGGRDADGVYTQLLERKMSREEWKAALRQYRSPRMRKELEVLREKGERGLEGMRDDVREILREEKLGRAIAEELERTDPELTEAVRRVKSEPLDLEARRQWLRMRTEKRNAWWQQRYREAQIEIKDERFTDVLKQWYE